MEDHDLGVDFGLLCRCCDNNSYQLPDVEGFTDSQRRIVEELCKMCVENCKPIAVNG